jgi:hypothetical protein
MSRDPARHAHARSLPAAASYRRDYEPGRDPADATRCRASPDTPLSRITWLDALSTGRTVRTFLTRLKRPFGPHASHFRLPSAPCRFAPGAGRRWPPRHRRTRRSPGVLTWRSRGCAGLSTDVYSRRRDGRSGTEHHAAARTTSGRAGGRGATASRHVPSFRRATVCGALPASRGKPLPRWPRPSQRPKRARGERARPRVIRQSATAGRVQWCVKWSVALLGWAGMSGPGFSAGSRLAGGDRGVMGGLSAGR